MLVLLYPDSYLSYTPFTTKSFLGKKKIQCDEGNRIQWLCIYSMSITFWCLIGKNIDAVICSPSSLTFKLKFSTN